MGEALCASASGMEPDPEFGVAEFRALARGEAHVAGEDELAAHATHAAPDLCEADNRRLRKAHEGIHQNREARGAHSGHDVSEIARQIEVRQVEVRNRALENNDTQGLSGIHPDKKVLEGLEDIRIDDIEGRIVEYDSPVRTRFLDHPQGCRRIGFGHGSSSLNFKLSRTIR